MSNIEIPSGISSLKEDTFEACTSLKYFVIPNGPTSIEEDCFCACVNLKYIVIPKSITSIEYDAFRQCRSLTDVYYEGTREEWNEVCHDTLINTTIHYESTGPDTGSDDNDSSTYGGPFSIKVFVEWNDGTNTAVFDSGITYQTDEDTDMSFVDNLDEINWSKSACSSRENHHQLAY